MNTTSGDPAAELERVLSALRENNYLDGAPSAQGEQRMFCPACEDPIESRTPSASLNVESGLFNCQKSSGEHSGTLAVLGGYLRPRGIDVGDIRRTTRRNVEPRVKVQPKAVSPDVERRLEAAELKLEDEGSSAALAHAEFLQKRRGLNWGTITKWRLGVEYSKRGVDDGEWRIWIPVIVDGQIVNVRKYKMGAAAGDKMRNVPGHGSGALLFGADLLAEHPDLPVLMCESEFDCILANQEAVQPDGSRLYVAVTGTGGASNVPANIDLLRGRDVCIAYDADQAGREGARKVAAALAKIDTAARLLDLTTLGLQPDSGKDITDYFGSDGSALGLARSMDVAEKLDPLAVADEEHAAQVEEQAERLRVQRDARSRLSAEGWERPTDQGSWAAQKDRPDEDVRWLIPQLAFEGANVVVNAQAKSGKTTLILNVAQAILSGDPLFGHFEVDPLSRGRSVAWWNAELSEPMAKKWLLDFDIPRSEALFPLHLRGYTMPFDVTEVEEWAVNWLRERQVSVWLIDPMSALFPGEENSNTEVGAWLAAIDRIKRRSGVDTLFLVHHVAETSAEDSDDPNSGRLLKGRGASRLTGWADVVWSYTGRFNEPRYIAALGRDVDLPQFGGLTKVGGGRSLRWNGMRSTPAEDRRRALAMDAYDKVAEAEAPLKAGELQALLPGSKPDTKRRAIAYAVEKRWLSASEGRQNSTLYSTGDADPRRFELRELSRKADEASGVDE